MEDSQIGKGTHQGQFGDLAEQCLPRLQVEDGCTGEELSSHSRHGSQRSELSSHYLSRVGPLETKLVEIWQEQLGIEKIGFDDHFFDLGGHSLQAISINNRIQELLGERVPLVAIFDAPTVKSLAEYLVKYYAAAVSKTCSTVAVPDRTLAQEPGRSFSEPTPKPANNPSVLSFYQERLWFFSQLGESGHAQNVTGWIRLRGPLETRTLEESIRCVVARHESLRSRFTDNSGTAELIVDAEPKFGWSIRDLSMTDAATHAQVFTDTLNQENLLEFNLERGPLLRFVLVRFGVDDFILIEIFHHVCTDGWSMGVFHQEVSAFYKALSQGIEVLLPELELQYSDFASWQRANLQGIVARRQIEFWRDNLAGAGTLQIPADRPRPMMGVSPSRTCRFELSVHVVSLLESFSRDHGVTPFMTLLAAYQILLARHTGQDDILVSVPTANRQHTAWEPLIGFFVNTVVMRTNLEGSPDFREVVARVRAVVLAALDNQDNPFDRVVEKLNPNRDLSRLPFAQVMFQLQEPQAALELPGITASAHSLPTAGTHSDQYLFVRRQPGVWKASLSWKSDIYDDAAMHRMAGHFVRLLEGLLTEPDQPCPAIRMMSDAERHQLLVEWNATAKNYPLDKCLHHLVEAQAQRTPDRIAVKIGNTNLTYSELNGKANQLAFRLRELGAGKGKCVSLLLRRSLELVISELAVMKTGAAFVPMDPDWPEARIEEILNQCNPSVVLTGGSESIAGYHGITVVESELTGIADNLGVNVGPADPIYVIFTSGSTGKPKGAINQHVGIVNRFHNMTDRFGCHPQDRILATTAPIFDSSVWQYFWPLVNGAQTVLPDPDADLDEVFALIDREGITFTDFVPSAFDILAARLLEGGPGQGEFRSLRQLIIGGEEISHERVCEFRKLRPEIELTNAYGPTETSIGVIFYEIPKEPPRRIPIGRPLHNVCAVIVDRNLRLVPVGVAGELCIGGVCVGLGYLDSREATEAAFVANPFPELDCSRLYRTGDHARYLPDGNIEFLGRFDQQVKVRGYRIELGEVESELLKVPGIQAAVVQLGGGEADDKKLCAYLVIQNESPVDGPTLRVRLAEHLPPYMIPARFLIIPELPLTRSGKVDRKALAKLEGQELKTGITFTPPRTDLEARMVEIWKIILRQEQVGVHDNFFDLGGHSLLALKLISKIREEMSTALPIKALFDFQTVATLSQELTRERWRARAGGFKLSRHLVSLRAGDPGKAPIILLPGGWGGDADLRFFSALLPSLGADHSVIGVNMRLCDPKYPFPSEVGTRAKRLLHEVLQHTGEMTFHLIAEGIASVVAIEMAGLAIAKRHNLGRLIIIDAQAPARKSIWNKFRRTTMPQRRPQMGEPVHASGLPSAVKKYYRLLGAHRPAKVDLPADLIVPAIHEMSSDCALKWRPLLPNLQIHIAKSVTPFQCLKAAFDMIESSKFRTQGTDHCKGPHVVSLQVGDDHTPPLVILPGGFGGENELLVFTRLTRFLAPSQPVLGVNMLSLETEHRTPFPDGVTVRARTILLELLEHTGTNGFHLVGECIAGSMAFELARQAKLAGYPILKLIMLDACCPSWWRAFRQRLFFKVHRRPSASSRPISETHPSSTPQSIKFFSRMLQAHQPESMDHTIHLICSQAHVGGDPSNGWNRLVTQVHRHNVPGTHQSYIRENAPKTAALIAELLLPEIN